MVNLMIGIQGSVGGTSSFGTFGSAFGGGGGLYSSTIYLAFSPGGGGIFSAGNTAKGGGPNAGFDIDIHRHANSIFGGGAGSSYSGSSQRSSVFGGGGTGLYGGHSLFGGAGGGCGYFSVTPMSYSGGVSTFGGNGGCFIGNPTYPTLGLDGSFPAGGGGGLSHFTSATYSSAGANGQVIVYVY